MVFQIAALVLVLVVTMLNSMYGLFSGIINVVCVVLSMVVALGGFEWCTDLVTGQFGWSPTYMTPICFVGLFVVTLTILRLATDNLIRGNVFVPSLVDWIGGGLCGFVIAQVCVGVLVFGFLLLPFGPRVAMYSRFSRTSDASAPKAEFSRSDLWLKSDLFTAGLFSLLSGGSLRGSVPFASVYPDFSKWVSWTGNTVQEESWTAPRRENNADGFEKGKGIRVESWWTAQTEVEGARYRAELPTREKPKPNYSKLNYTPETGMRLLGARLVLDDASADGPERGGYHRFRPTMIRVVGELSAAGGGTGRTVDYAARLLSGADETIGDAFRVADIDNNFALNAAGPQKIDVYFEVDDGFVPRFVEYRRFARADIDKTLALEAAPGARAKPAVAATPAQATQNQPQASGVTRFLDAIVQSRTGVVDDIGFAFSREKLARVPDMTLDADRIASGRVSGSRPNFRVEGRDTEVRRLAVPDNYRLFQFTCKSRRAQSLGGQTFDFVAATLNQYRCIDSAANEYPLAGYMAVMPADRNEKFELFFAGADPTASGYNGTLDFKHIQKNELRDTETELTLFFLVRKGVKLVKVENQLGHGIDGLNYESPQ